jgi:TolA-binding protein
MEIQIQIQKLKKKILLEELKRRRKNSKKHRLLIRGALLVLILLFGGLIYYMTHLGEMLTDDYSQAEALLEEQRYEQAVEAFRQIYEHHPSFSQAPQAIFQAGEILNIYLQNYHEAVLAYLLVEKDYPNTELSRRAQRQVADIYKNRLRDYPRAIVAYQKLLDSGAEGGDRIQYEVADTYFRLENFEQARIEFESLLKNYPGSALLPEVEYRIAVAWTLEGHPKEAESVFRRVSERWPESTYALEARYGLATSLEERDELSEALKVLESLKGSYPNTEAVAKKIEQVQERMRKKKKAI